MFKKKEHFLFLLAASVVIFTSIVIVSRHMEAGEIKAEVEGAKTYNRQRSVSDSAEGLMRLLRQTVDDGGAAELKQLEREARGL